MLLAPVSSASPRTLYPWIAALVSTIARVTLIFSFILTTEEEEWDTMEAVKIKHTPFE